MFVVTYRKIFFILSGIIVGLSFLSVAFFGLQFGIDFTGGAITEVSYPDGRPDKVVLEEQLNPLSVEGYSLRPTGENGYILRTRDLTEEERIIISKALSINGTVQVVEERYNSIGPIIGTELRNKAFFAIAIVVLAIILFIAFVFRKVSEPVSSLKYGLIAIVALLHDIIIPIGMFAVLGVFVGAQVDVLFVMALLAILGYSVNDTIVVFDRVRENLRTNKELNIREDFELTVGKSLNQTYTRSINTSLTTLFVLLTLFFVGAPVTQNFALVLMTGVIAGTYSSIFLAAPLLVTIQRLSEKRN
ncbi:protein translocase subunit SecF [Patescibacteria group bacterium]|nr:protein translocase subunit SecF [Patescibacteria group bacterium]